ncbi:MAG: hypothetical protein PVJ41_12530 [Desulfobacterales bacterium]|jgi:hypothetical protein
MKKKMIFAFMALLLGCVGLWACSSRNDSESDLESQKGVIEEMTDKAAQKAINRIRTPLDKARTAANQEEDRMNDMDESLRD